MQRILTCLFPLLHCELLEEGTQFWLSLYSQFAFLSQGKSHLMPALNQVWKRTVLTSVVLTFHLARQFQMIGSNLIIAEQCD